MSSRAGRLSTRLSAAAAALCAEYPDTALLTLRANSDVYVELGYLRRLGLLRISVPVRFVLREASLPDRSMLLWQSDVMVEVVRGHWRPAARVVHDVDLADREYEVYARLVADGVPRARALELSEVL